MRKLLTIVVCAVLSVTVATAAQPGSAKGRSGGNAVGASKATPATPTAPSTSAVTPATAEAKPAPALTPVAMKDWAEKHGLSVIPTKPTDDLPPCPTVRVCSCTFGCTPTGEETDTDTGLTQCTDGSQTFTCGAGKTIHTQTRTCSQCACCSAQNPCLCPNNCGVQQLVACR